MSELKACPFCGGSACYIEPMYGYRLPNGEVSQYVSCVNPGCMPHNTFILVKTWQSRTIESALQSALTTAQEEVKEIQHGFEILSLSNGNLREENKRLHELVVDTYNILNHGRNTTQSENYEVFDRLENEALNGGKND